MYYRNYDEYMRNTLDNYKDMTTNDATVNNTAMNGMAMNNVAANDMVANNVATNNMAQNTGQDLEGMYPDIYKVIHPMVAMAASNINMPVTEEWLGAIVDNIYDRLEADGRINLGMNFNMETDVDSRYPRPRHRDRHLRDLIRILLLREIIGGRRPIRPF